MEPVICNHAFQRGDGKKKINPNLGAPDPVAGEWIKMRLDLGDDPAVVKIALELRIAQDEVVGKLHRLWSWADKHTIDGSAPGITPKWVDKYVGRRGFADAMKNADWLVFTEAGVQFPNFDRHNGLSAKRRGENTIRQRLSRADRDDGLAGEERDSVPNPFRRHVLDRDESTCVYCGLKSGAKMVPWSRKVPFSIDHIVPISRGGKTTIDNLATCCQLCNMEKSDRTPEEWGIIPTFLANHVTYVSQKICDNRASKTRPEGEIEEEEELEEDQFQKKKRHAFTDSELHPFEKFRAAFPEWTEAKCRHWFQQALDYSQINGGRYLNWRLAVLKWDRKEPFKGPEARKYM
jgi:hypothetical protein